MESTPLAAPHVIAQRIRRRVLEHVLNNDGGYLSQACSAAEILATLYARVMTLGPSLGARVPPPFAGVPGPGRETPSGGVYNGAHSPKLDRFIFSPVHYALVLYAALIEVGRLGEGALERFDQDGSAVEMIGAEHSPGIELTAGSLGQAISQAAGIALARKLRQEPGRVWVFMSDGEFQEGQPWEAFAAAAYHGLDNLGVYVDANGQQCDGAMEQVMSVEPLAQRLAAFGAEVKEVDGHDCEALRAATRTRGVAPQVVICRTDPCRGLELLRERAPRLHYLRFQDDDERARYRQALERWGEETN